MIPGALPQFAAACRIAAQFADCRDKGGGVAALNDQPAFRLTTERGDLSVHVANENKVAGLQQRINLAGEDKTLELRAQGNKVHVGLDRLSARPSVGA